jgi:hypothetical protein
MAVGRRSATLGTLQVDFKCKFIYSPSRVLPERASWEFSENRHRRRALTTLSVEHLFLSCLFCAHYVLLLRALSCCVNARAHHQQQAAPHTFSDSPRSVARSLCISLQRSETRTRRNTTSSIPISSTQNVLDQSGWQHFNEFQCLWRRITD